MRAKPVSVEAFRKFISLAATTVGLLPPSELTAEQSEKLIVELDASAGQ